METPPLLLLDTEREYIERLRQEYDKTQIILPEGKKVLFFLEHEKNCKHALSGKEQKRFNHFRAQRILWIKFILENKSIREVKQNVWHPENIVFYCQRLGYVVVCNILSGGDLKFVTQYVNNKDFIKSWKNPKEYYEFLF